MRKEFLSSSASELSKANQIIETKGRDAYLDYYTDRNKECSRLVKEHQKEIVEAADRMSKDDEKR